MNRPKVYIITGISGSGKTTIGRALIELGEVAFDSKITPGIYHFVDSNGEKPVKIEWNNVDWHKSHVWSLNRNMLESLLRQHADSQRIFLCGRANLFQYMDIASKTFLLKISAGTLLDRLKDERRDNLFAKDEVTQQRLVAELDAVQARITQRGAVVIDAEQSIKHIVLDILGKVS